MLCVRRETWRILSREWGRLTYKGLGEECRWKMGYRSKYGDESIAKAAASHSHLKDD